MDTRLNFRTPVLTLAVASILVLTAAPSAMAQFEGIDVHGFAGQGFMSSTTYNYLTPSVDGSWAMGEYAVNVGSNLSDDLRVGVQFFARNLGDLGNNDVGVDWAFGDYRRHDWLGVRGGRVKMPYGLYNESADFDHVRTSVLMPQGVYDLRMRELRTALNGINPYGTLDGGAAGELEYSFVAGYVSHPRDGSLAKFFNDTDMYTFYSMDNDRTLGGQLIWNTPLSGLRVGHTMTDYMSNLTLVLDPMVAAMIGVADPMMSFSDNQVTVHTSSAEYSRGNIVLASEYNTWTGDFGDNVFNFAMDWENWYVQGSYRFNQWFEAGSYYSVHYEDRNNRSGEGVDPPWSMWQKDVALSFRFDITPSMIFKLEGHMIDGNASVLSQDNLQLIANPDDVEQNWYMFASKLSFVF